MFNKLSAQKITVQHPSPFRLLLVLAVTIFATEMLVMAVIASWLPPMPESLLHIVDSAMLVLLVFPVFYYLVFRPMKKNIGELSSLEQARRANEATLRAMMDNSPYRVWLKDAGGRYLAVNGQFAKACGIEDPEDVVGKTSREVLPRELAENYCEADNLVMAQREPLHIEERIVENGQERWFGIFRTPILDERGNVLGTTGFARDITDRKTAEEQMRLTAKIFASSHDSIAITDPAGNIISINPAFSDITGYDSDEVLGKNPRILNSGRQGKEFYLEMWRCVLQNGYWSGEVWNRRKDGGTYAGRLTISALRDETDKVTHYIGVTSDITEYKLAQERIRQMAFYDQLTGLPNRSLLQDRVDRLFAQVRRDERAFAILFIDLDNFKRINDSLGHHVGDLLLQDVALRLNECVREVDTVSRQGGDEFVVLLPDTDSEGAGSVAEKIVDCLTRPHMLSGHEVVATPSIGISMYPRDGGDFETLSKHADTALYRVKAEGKAGFQFFTPEMNVAAHERMELESRLRHALENKGFSLSYQPQFDRVRGQVVGVEALIRWNDPQLGTVMPDDFIPIAEENGLIVQIGQWVLREACAQTKVWLAAGLPCVPVSVNISAVQLKQADFVQVVTGALSDAGLEARYLELELTERVVMADVEHTVRVMSELSALGVGLSVDDFGTGYSSLAYLKRFPLKKLKIDKSFVHDLAFDQDDRTIANSIILLAHGLNVTVVAEGVENGQQLDILRGQGCDMMQGFFFSKPLPAAEYAVFMRGTKSA
ncbi:MAG: EAL domain-containing protein [Gallionella sp.]|nr:EAL domain-containing protein [Gallionella sp.]